jgi:hypothetical protein
MASDVFAYKHLAESGAVKTGPGVLHSLLLSAAGVDATATVYDETAGSGDVMAVVTSVQDASECVVLDVAFGVGCYVAITGTGAKVTVSYK